MTDFLSRATTEEIEDYFKYHSPSEEQLEKYEKIRAKLKECALLIGKLCPEGHDKQLAIVYLKSACMWANTSIAIKG